MEYIADQLTDCPHYLSCSRFLPVETSSLAVYQYETTNMDFVMRQIQRILSEYIAVYNNYTRSVRKVSDRICLCEHLMDYNLARLHEPTLNLSAHA